MSKGNPPPDGNGAGALRGARAIRKQAPARRHPASGQQPPAGPGAQAPAGSAPRSNALRCPACGKPAAWEDNPSRPFCSERCRLLDLGKWADGSYAIPAEPVPDKDDEE
jgi:endogenous inhibitor of DNA gyrase (YacG/DUF329 family)